MKHRADSKLAVAAAIVAMLGVGALVMSYRNQPRTIALACPNVVATLPDGYLINAEVANTRASQAKGLSGRTSLANDAGMLFAFPSEGTYGFWMKDTLIPLDIIWINDSTVVDTTSLTPQSGTYIPSYTPDALANTVLELNEGSIERHNITIGSKITWNSC